MKTQTKIRKRPAIRWHGGKWMLAPWIISFFPEHRIYTEAFGGGASILLRKERAYAEVYNDLDGEIVNVFLVIRDQGKKLKAYLEGTPFSRTVFFDAYRPGQSSLKRAANTIIKSFMGFGSDSIRNKSGFRSNCKRSGTTPAHDWANYPKHIPFFSERLKGVVIENRPAVDILKTHDGPDTLHYIDPPYLHSTRQSSKRYAIEMSDQEHRELAEVIRSLKGKVIISGYESSLYDELYHDYRKVTKDALADGARKRVEVLWMNF